MAHRRVLAVIAAASIAGAAAIGLLPAAAGAATASVTTHRPAGHVAGEARLGARAAGEARLGAHAKSPASRLRWSALKHIDPTFQAGIVSVSCPTTHFCAGLQYDTVTTYNGSRWNSPVRIVPTPSSLGMYSISCASSTFCGAVGDEGFAPFTTFAVTYNGKSWSKPA